MAEQDAGTEAASETDETAPPTGEATTDTDAADHTSADADDGEDKSDTGNDDDTTAAGSDSDDAGNGEDAVDGGSEEDATPGSGSGSGEVMVEGGLDIEAERKRLDDVENQIEEGRRTLAESDLEDADEDGAADTETDDSDSDDAAGTDSDSTDTDDDPSDPPVAEGAANAPPG